MTTRFRPSVLLSPLVVLAVLASGFALVWTPGTSEAPPVEPDVASAEEPQEPLVTALEGPWVVAAQPGHWRIDEVPDEHARRRGDVGGITVGMRGYFGFASHRFYASIVHRGLSSYFAGRDRTDTASLIPREFDIMAAAEGGASVRRSSDPHSGVVRRPELQW